MRQMKKFSLDSDFKKKLPAQDSLGSWLSSYGVMTSYVHDTRNFILELRTLFYNWQLYFIKKPFKNKDFIKNRFIF